MADIYIKLDALREMSTQLTQISDEFANATNNSEALESAIGNPFGRGELRNQAKDFEERWDNKRKNLAEELDAVIEHLNAVIENTEQWDEDAAIALEPEAASAAGN